MAPSQSTLRHGRRPLPFLRRSIPSPQRNPDPLSRDWQLDAAYETLQQYNLIGLPVTWSEQENDWTEWLRYVSTYTAVTYLRTDRSLLVVLCALTPGQAGGAP
jgi:hypothetical protein